MKSNQNVQAEQGDILTRVKTATLATQRHDWEQGVVAQAFLESGDIEIAVALAEEAVNRQTKDGRCSQLGGGHSVTDPCSVGEALIAACEETGDEKLIRAKDALLGWALTGAPRNSNGIVYHLGDLTEFWVDSFYMLPPFLARAGEYEEAMRQINGWWDALYREDNGLLAHRFDDRTGRYARRDAWGVGNGWAIAGMARVIGLLPKEYRAEKELLIGRIRLILDHARPYQREDGMFPNVLDDPASFPEVNFGQMAAYTVRRGITEGWLEQEYEDMAERCYEAAVRSVDRFGFVRNVCGIPDFDAPGCAPEGQAFFILMESARNNWLTIRKR